MNTILLRRVNIGSDAQIKDVEGQKVIEFSVAENRRYKDSAGKEKESTTWYSCSWWTSKTAVADFLKKGASVNIIGKLSASAYLNKSNNPVADLRVSVMEIDLLDKKDASAGSAEKPSDAEQPPADQPPADAHTHTSREEDEPPF